MKRGSGKKVQKKISRWSGSKPARKVGKDEIRPSLKQKEKRWLLTTFKRGRVQVQAQGKAAERGSSGFGVVAMGEVYNRL